MHNIDHNCRFRRPAISNTMVKEETSRFNDQCRLSADVDSAASHSRTYVMTQSGLPLM